MAPFETQSWTTEFAASHASLVERLSKWFHERSLYRIAPTRKM